MGLNLQITYPQAQYSPFFCQGNGLKKGHLMEDHDARQDLHRGVVVVAWWCTLGGSVDNICEAAFGVR